MGLSAINLNRFNNDLTVRFLQNPNAALAAINKQSAAAGQATNSNFTLGFGNTNTSANALNANSVFTTLANEFTPGYKVNQPSNQATLFDKGSYIALSSSGTFLRNGNGLQLQSIDAAQNFNRTLGLDFSATGSRFTPSFSANTTTVAPNAPTTFADQLNRYAISEANFNELKNGPDFVIGRTGPLGFKVLTDGAGNITGIETTTAEQANRFDASALNSGALANRAEITTGATFQSLRPGDVLSGGVTQTTILPGQPALKENANTLPVQDLLLKGLLDVQRFSGPYTEADLGPKAGEQTPVVDNLYKLLAQKEGQGQAVTGIDSTLKPEQALQLAAVKSGFGVELSNNEAYSRNVKSLQNAELAKGPQLTPYQQANQLAQVVPMFNTVLAAPARSAADMGLAANTSDNGSSLGADVAEKRGSAGGYMPFGGGTSGFSGGSNPFAGGGSAFGSGQQQEQPQPQKRPLRLLA